MTGGFAAWWAGLGRGQRVGAVVVALVLAVNLVFSAMDSIVGGGDPGGPASSSTSTGSSGLEAYADLLADAGHEVRRLEDPIGEEPLDPAATLVIADPEQLTEDELVAIAEWLPTGGRLLVAGGDTSGIVLALTGVQVGYESGDAEDALAVWVPGDDVGGAVTIAGDAGGRWTDVGPLLPLAGGDDGPTLLAAQVGEGRLLALADADPLHNEHLASADNAALGLGLAGEPGRPVVFAESVHGAGGDWQAAVPASWRWAAAGLAVALVLGLWSAGARFGPPEPDHRALRPPRMDHVRAVAAGVQRAGGPPRDLAAALEEGAAAAAADRRRLGVADPDGAPTATVPAHPHRGGTTP